MTLGGTIPMRIGAPVANQQPVAQRLRVSWLQMELRPSSAAASDRTSMADDSSLLRLTNTASITLYESPVAAQDDTMLYLESQTRPGAANTPRMPPTMSTPITTTIFFGWRQADDQFGVGCGPGACS